MRQRAERLRVIRALLSSREISSQDELLDELEKRGFNVTQATVSRDMKILKTAKTATVSGRYVYVLPGETMYKRINKPYASGVDAEALALPTKRESPQAETIRFSYNLCVIRTSPGHAGAIAYNIDSAEISGVLGTIAGDDTIIIVMKEGADRELLADSLKRII